MYALLLTIALTAVPSVAYADCGTSTSSKGQVLQAVGETGGDCSGAGVTDLVHTVVVVLSYFVGVVAVIMIILAGFKYITSGGDANKVGSAKNTLIYAMVGIAVAALAQLIVKFVLFQTK